MIDDRYYVKIVPHRGETVHRFEVRRRHIGIAAAVLALITLGSLVFTAFQIVHARAQVTTLRQQALSQQATLTQIDKQTQALRRELQHVQKQNQEIRQLIGAPAPKPTKSTLQKTSWVRSGPTLPAVAENVHDLALASHATTTESDTIKRLTMHLLNIRHLRDLARAQMVAAIPSIDPVDGAEVVGCFCYRTYPDTEFHEGVDLGADYGDPVRATAAGTVVSAGYDGGYGIKIDIDHGNGYHTWYAHLSRVNVHAGQHVYKGETVAAVGSTGFSTGPHLHYQLMRNGVPIDPTPYLHGVPSNVLASLP
ncbi:MAG TPA: M23 family metallopeptidase [Candidatus Baltobacteraceae bacterium]|jgi:murein DD-endopeptidase MepM/ murein hydrolase activator NlpD|nr:M23 family metallopeptidase [Candidatus Baltobacteraceae bacterium]